MEWLLYNWKAFLGLVFWGGLLVILLALLVVYIIARRGGFQHHSTPSSPPSAPKASEDTPQEAEFLCPNCGSPATVHGKRWECPWCGDFGDLN